MRNAGSARLHTAFYYLGQHGTKYRSFPLGRSTPPQKKPNMTQNIGYSNATPSSDPDASLGWTAAGAAAPMADPDEVSLDWTGDFLPNILETAKGRR